MSKKRPSGLEGFNLGLTAPGIEYSDPSPEGTSVDPETPGDYHVVPRATAGPVAETSFIDDTETSGSRDEAEMPPPTYDEAVGGYVEVPQDEQAAGVAGAPLAGAESDALTADEIAIVLKMQEDRGNYIPKTPAKTDDEEEMQMLNPNSSRVDDTNTSINTDGNTARLVLRQEQLQPEIREPVGSVHSMELGETRRQDRSDFECTDCGPLDAPITRVGRFLKSLSGPRLIILLVVVIGLMLLAVFLGVFCSSFVYVEYHEIALKQSKMTGSIDRDHVYYDGCYVLGPDTEFVRFPATAQEIDETLSVFTMDTISITISFSIQYFLRPEEVGQLHKDFSMDYDKVFRILISSSVKNLAGTSLTVDNFRFNRTYVEVQMHNMLRKKLGGDCCPACCPRNCQSNTYCSQCNSTSSCDQGHHIDVRYFSLKRVTIPNEVFERYLKQTILGIQQETEFFIQEYKVIKIGIDRETKKIRNEAEEIEQEAYAKSNRIKTVAEADFEKIVQNSYAKGLKGLFSNLSVTQEDHKLSLMMIRALEEEKDNLYSGYAYEHTLFEN